jgi:hypothetical protein
MAFGEPNRGRYLPFRGPCAGGRSQPQQTRQLAARTPASLNAFLGSSTQSVWGLGDLRSGLRVLG